MTPNVIESSGDVLARKMRIAKEEADPTLTYSAIGEALGVDQRTVAGWLAQPPRSRPSYARLSAYAALTKRSISFFFDEEAAA